jgi:hypothetical protein
LFSSLLFQLCRQLGTVPGELGMLKDMANQQLQFELLFRAFAVAVRRFPQIFIVVDAVDECSDSRRLIATLQSMIDWELDGLHLFLSTRPVPSIREHLKRPHHLYYVSMTNENRQDILCLINTELSKQKIGDLSDATRQDVMRQLADRAEGS